MGIPVVKQCCCGCRLDTGSTIIGWLDVVGAVLMIVGGIVGIVGVVGAPKGDTDVPPSMGTYIAMVISGIIRLLIGIMLLIGVSRRAPKYVHNWIIIALLSLIMYFFFLVINGVMTIVNVDIASGAISLVAGIIVTLINFYFICVVSSFHKEIQAENRTV